MQQPIPIGTVLQSRYRLIKILGQGGFGRTYLATDQGRFNELCALKELIPAQTGNYFLEKSKELFQREAAILYQIQHPQVPQFRATFEQDQRLFLVQDYVEGKTYRTMLDERKVAGCRFAEAEVLHLLRQLLPVLAHLHIRGIIHRDISPDNIILRERDAKPVLIDFGIVKELATRFQSPNGTHQTTRVGKLGYAPSEQIQTGRAYPSSDLYALAVTSVVLLTAREPQELFDDSKLEWNWQRWVKVSPQVSRVLNRMLSYKPSDRYQSVALVAKALPAQNHQPNHGSLAAESSGQPLSPQLPTLNHRPLAPESSHIQIITLNRRPDLIQPNTSKPLPPGAVIPAPTNREIWDNPWAIAVIGIGIAIFAGIGSWALVSHILTTNQQRPIAPQTFPSPLVSESPTPTPTETATPTVDVESIKFNATQTARQVSGQIKPQHIKRYLVNVQEGQLLFVAVKQGAVTLNIRYPDSQIIEDAANVLNWQGQVPSGGDYQVDVIPIQELDTNFSLDVSVLKLE